MLVLTTFFLQTAVAGIFLTSGLSKIRGEANLRTWSDLAERLRVPRFPARAASHTHVAVELLVGAALLAGAWARVPALVAATLLFAAFALLALYSVRAEKAVTCSCFGKAESALGWPHVWRNAVLTVLAAAGLGCSLALGPELPTPGGAAVALAAAVAVAAVAFYFDDLVDLFSPGAGGTPSAPLPHA
ncbi:MauE/DoxX family redox-associated membrane protein [Nocardiopsis lambiniae]|uniref:MauE/DoxX family redox-associated membrane protein n=1 Tax=Nocardiopsis lambiniae TaxID=3075539 RepID=A0ABU2MBE0_9ACTN|nr:MauE/DoxX family redox-associated membrane protein [Nocardiopsis sp. DSM 44743]MDT0329999.1 MauE/DoxX family redox-associated membrane protein [Nocardiopsis sp. DSM 44743]